MIQGQVKAEQKAIWEYLTKEEFCRMENKDRKLVFLILTELWSMDRPIRFRRVQWRRSVNFAKMDTWHLSIRDGRW